MICLGKAAYKNQQCDVFKGAKQFGNISSRNLSKDDEVPLKIYEVPLVVRFREFI